MVFCHKQKNMARLKRLVLVVDENAVNQVLKMLTAIAELSQRKIEVASEDEIEAMSEKEDAVNDNKSSESFNPHCSHPSCNSLISNIQFF